MITSINVSESRTMEAYQQLHSMEAVTQKILGILKEFNLSSMKFQMDTDQMQLQLTAKTHSFSQTSCDAVLKSK